MAISKYTPLQVCEGRRHLALLQSRLGASRFHDGSPGNVRRHDSNEKEPTEEAACGKTLKTGDLRHRWLCGRRPVSDSRKAPRFVMCRRSCGTLCNCSLVV